MENTDLCRGSPKGDELEINPSTEFNSVINLRPIIKQKNCEEAPIVEEDNKLSISIKSATNEYSPSKTNSNKKVIFNSEIISKLGTHNKPKEKESLKNIFKNSSKMINNNLADSKSSL